MPHAEQIALARAVTHWHLFSDKTTDPKPGEMTLEQAEAILEEFERDSDPKNMITLSVFYFGEDPGMGRMGTSLAYMLGIADNGDCYWDAPGENIPPQAEPVHFQGIQPLPYAFVRREEIDDSYPVRRLLNGRNPDEFSLGDMVDAGMGNWGFALGLRQCIVVPSEADSE